MRIRRLSVKLNVKYKNLSTQQSTFDNFVLLARAATCETFKVGLHWSKLLLVCAYSLSFAPTQLSKTEMNYKLQLHYVELQIFLHDGLSFMTYSVVFYKEDISIQEPV